MAKKIGYLRVSTQEQRPDRQIDGLKALCDEIHIEKLSAAARHRPVFDAVIAELAAGDTFLVWDLDRAFRSTLDALQVADELRQRRIHFQIATLNIDTSTEFGELLYTVVAAFARFERRILVRRTNEGLAAAKRRGKRFGRPPKLTPTHLRFARKALNEETATVKELAARFGVVPWTLTRALRKLERETGIYGH